MEEDDGGPAVDHDNDQENRGPGGPYGGGGGGGGGGGPDPHRSFSSGAADERKDEATVSEGDLFPGQQLDALDSVGKWCEAEVLEVEADGRGVQLTYTYWGDAWNEWVRLDSGRLALYGTHTYQPGGVLRRGQRVEVLDTMQKWLEAEVIGEQAGSVKVHFKNWHVKFDEWLPRASERIRPYGRHKKLVKVPPASRQLSLKRAQSQERVRRMASTSAQFDRYQGALAEGGLHVHPVEGDGNCMFRSVSHQIYGDDRHHMLVRQMCMDYMESEKEYFEPYVVGDMDDFLAYLGQKRRNAVWGDDPEVQAMCELYDRPAEIWGFDPKAGARKLRTFHETSGSNHDRQPMRLSYYGGGHYDSIVGPGHAENVSRAAPGVTEQARIEWSRARAACSDVEETKQQSDVAATEAAELDLALAASRSDFDRQAVDLECIFSEVQQLEWATSQADLERTNEELVHSIAAQSAREHDRVQDLEALKRSEELELQQALAMSSQGATANGADDEQLQRALAMSAAGGDDFERALALSSAQVGAGGAADASADELQRALAMSAAEAGPTGLDPELEIALALSSNEGGGGFTADEDDEVMRAIALSRQGFS